MIFMENKINTPIKRGLKEFYYIFLVLTRLIGENNCILQITNITFFVLDEYYTFFTSIKNPFFYLDRTNLSIYNRITKSS